MARQVPVLAVLLALGGLVGAGLLVPSAPVVAAADTPLAQNDAGSGRDAGDTPANALLLPAARRAWSANLTPPGSDMDWYRLATDGAFCAAAETTSSATGHLVLTSDPTRFAAVDTMAEAHTATRLTLAAPAGRAPYLGLEPASSFAMVEGAGRPNPGRYSFTLTSSSYADLDPERDGETPEAGATLATAAPIPAGCAAGRLGGAGDGEDRYAFDVTQPRALALSFAVASGRAASLRVLTPSGATYTTLASGDAATVWADEPGRWTVAIAPDAANARADAFGLALPLALASDYDTTEYLLGVLGPDPEPCRPSCLR